MFVATWKLNGKPNPCTDLDKILHTHRHLSKEGFGAVLTLGGLKLLQLKDAFLKTFYKTKDVK